MAKLSTHVLDTANGIPARNMRLELYRLEQANRKTIVSTITNQDGRTDTPLLADDMMEKGTYEIHFFVAEYFQRMADTSASMPFLDIVPIRFCIAENDKNYHIPLLVSPWAYSTYRGS